MYKENTVLYIKQMYTSPSFLVKARWHILEKQVGSKQSELFPSLLRNFWKESATCTHMPWDWTMQFVKALQAESEHSHGRTMPFNRNMREALYHLIIKFYMLLIKQKVPLLTSVTSMTLMAASWPVLTWRPWVREREQSAPASHPSLQLTQSKTLEQEFQSLGFPMLNPSDTSWEILQTL